MAVEYSYTASQVVPESQNILFTNGEKVCTRGLVVHRNNSGVFQLKNTNGCMTTYKITFNANVAVAPAESGGVLAPVSVALQEFGETMTNAIATVTPAAIGDFFNVSITALVTLTRGCCVSVAVQNISDGTAIEVTNANLIINQEL